MLRAAAFVACLGVAFGAPKIPPMRPEVLGVAPHGAQRGTSVELTIRGRNLQGASRIMFANSQISAEILSVEHNALRARFHVDAAAEPGRHDFRVVAPHGSTLQWFEVSARPETPEKEPNNDRPRAQTIQMPVLVNGTVTAGDYDYFQFAAGAGQTLTFDVNATRHGSQIDTVIDLLDSEGAQLDYSDDYYMFKDPHLVHTFAKSGTYYLRVYGSGEAGSPNAAYRLTAGAMPQVDRALPGGGRRGATVEFELNGVNLDSVARVTLGGGVAVGDVLSKSPRAARVRMAIPAGAEPGVYRLHVEALDSGPAAVLAPFVISALPEITVRGKEARSKSDPLPVELPLVVNGALDVPKAADYFTFRVDAPRTILLQVDSMGLGFMLDPLVAIYDESGRRIGWQDDPTTNTGRHPVNLDPHFTFQLPKAGRYTAMVRDSESRGDPSYAYRLTLKPAEPDFTATVQGTDETLYRGRENIVTVTVRRLEGWNAPVEVWAENLPPGVTAKRAVAAPADSLFRNTCGEEHKLDGTWVEIPFQVDAAAPATLSRIRFRARGVMDGRTVEHEARPHYQWKIRQNVLGYSETPDLYATVADPPQLVLTAPDRVSVARGGTSKIKVVVIRLDDGDQPLEISAQPAEGLSIAAATVAPGGTQAEVAVTRSGDATRRIVLEGSVNGKVIGRSQPIVVDSNVRPAAEVIADEN